MMERGDLKVLHEPFSYLYYVHQDRATISQQYVDPEHPTDYEGIKAHISAAAARQPVFFKDMCSHCFEPLVADEAILKQINNNSDHLKGYYDRLKPFYDRIYAHRILPEAQG